MDRRSFLACLAAIAPFSIVGSSLLSADKTGMYRGFELINKEVSPRSQYLLLKTVPSSLLIPVNNYKLNRYSKFEEYSKLDVGQILIKEMDKMILFHTKRFPKKEESVIYIISRENDPYSFGLCLVPKEYVIR